MDRGAFLIGLVMVSFGMEISFATVFFTLPLFEGLSTGLFDFSDFAIVGAFSLSILVNGLDAVFVLSNLDSA